jgi:hypothetical protein
MSSTVNLLKWRRKRLVTGLWQRSKGLGRDLTLFLSYFTSIHHSGPSHGYWLGHSGPSHCHWPGRRNASMMETLMSVHSKETLSVSGLSQGHVEGRNNLGQLGGLCIQSSPQEPVCKCVCIVQHVTEVRKKKWGPCFYERFSLLFWPSRIVKRISTYSDLHVYLREQCDHWPSLHCNAPPTHPPTFICIYAHTHVHAHTPRQSFRYQEGVLSFRQSFRQEPVFVLFLHILEEGGRDMDRWGRNKNKPRNDSEKVRRTFVCVYNLTHSEFSFTHASVRVSRCDSDLHVHREKYDD